MMPLQYLDMEKTIMRENQNKNDEIANGLKTQMMIINLVRVISMAKLLRL